ncbi:DUF1189 domain-containing protein [Inconstantimicrobium mannanitabidum]|uniref:Uncharacterized protein n=1 Tax=Inconstantimicrobium mannanitabidum TaxID=1604901 RepID=A0ACB5RHX3_9CLOT|nr:DUF1189 domain-containing protein [Clostridium sp. TW13]GKX68677.1 hypothetical protein rsdtw13_39350 [Clostridium sp. TW13]
MSLFQSFIKSLYDFKNYAKFLSHSVLKVTVYFLLVTGIFGALSTVGSIPDINNSKQLKQLIDNHLSQVPDFEVKDNELKIEGNMPKILKEGEMMLRFDPDTDDVKGIKDVKGAIFFGKKALHFMQPNGSFSEKKYSEITNVKFNKKYLSDYSSSLGLQLFIQIFINIVKSIMVGLVMAFITALISLQFTKMGGKKLKFGELFKLSIYATTIPIIIYSILCIIAINFQFAAWILIIIPVLYVRKAINCMMAEEEAKTKKVKKKK